MQYKKITTILLMLVTSNIVANAKAIVEYSESSDWNKKTIKNLQADEKFKINVEKFGWKNCSMWTNDAKTAIYATCYVDEKKSVIFNCYGDETIEIAIAGNQMASIRLICSYK